MVAWMHVYARLEDKYCFILNLGKTIFLVPVHVGMPTYYMYIILYMYIYMHAMHMHEVKCELMRFPNPNPRDWKAKTLTTAPTCPWYMHV